MHSIRLQKHLPYTANQLMDLALDVEVYHQFVPFCERCVIRERFERQGKDVMVAAMTVGVSIFNETFVSRVIADREVKTIRVAGIDGPLKALVNNWQFHERDDGTTDIDFSVSFEFRSRMLSMLASSRVEDVCNRILNAFVDRAHAKLGAPEHGTPEQGAAKTA
ncbi:MAG: type II toxin-antitoxin system RatA family toxin [Pseudomonadota bacterium]